MFETTNHLCTVYNLSLQYLHLSTVGRESRKRLFFFRLPSGKLIWLWKTTIFNGKIHYKWSFSIAMLVYQRVLSAGRKHGDLWNLSDTSPLRCGSSHNLQWPILDWTRSTVWSSNMAGDSTNGTFPWGKIWKNHQEGISSPVWPEGNPSVKFPRLDCGHRISVCCWSKLLFSDPKTTQLLTSVSPRINILILDHQVFFLKLSWSFCFLYPRFKLTDSWKTPANDRDHFPMLFLYGFPLFIGLV